ncbi:PP2C family protein-serine/threonine phosphatase [Streptomyces nigra]|uniref:PP2C family protein-serine/threonine phosphatase n=1 Tax=Streptomyces nigra TaxID=1827580 RepID=UPI0037F1A2A9
MDSNPSVGSGELLLEELVRTAQLASPAELPVVLNRYTEAVGLGTAAIYLVDIQQRLLVPFVEVEGEPDVDLDTSLAGWTYRANSLRVGETPSGELDVWLPLADGAERLGVVEFTMDTLDGLRLRRCRTTALLIRRHRLLRKALDRPSEPPLGLPARLAGPARQVHEVRLEPGDRILLYSDGVVESRNEAGEEFGLERFTDYIIRSTAAGQNAPEVLRLLIHSILDHRQNRLSDDATILLFEWQPTDP